MREQRRVFQEWKQLYELWWEFRGLRRELWEWKQLYEQRREL